MKEALITINSFSIVRNPYERLVALYDKSWRKVGFSVWLNEEIISPQADLVVTKRILHLEKWQEELQHFNLDPSGFTDVPEPVKNWQRWYDARLVHQVEAIVKKDLLTFGYYRFQK